jgi:hypothetical protein
MRRLGLFLVLGLLAIGCEKAAPKTVTAAGPAVHDAAAIRRVCIQMGLGRAGAGGGSIVFSTGPEAGGVGVDTLRGEHVVAPGTNPLCTVPEQKMRVCPADAEHTGEVVVTDGIGPSAKPVGTLQRESALAFYEYVSVSDGSKAVVNVDGKAGFISGDDVCHLVGTLPTSRATTALGMDVSVKAGPKAFRPRSPATIQRIVIHNTEIPLEQTMHVFGRPEANTSAHVVIDRDGKTFRVVEDQFAAFHAGSSKDRLGGHNSTSLGIEVVAYDDPTYGGEHREFSFFSEAQRQAVIKLIDFWMAEYKLTIAPEVLANRSSVQGYADLEYGRAALTIHRLTKADRGTDCPRLLFPNSSDGDDEFFRWREATFNPTAQRLRMR